jgi:hypothetical protein
MQTTLVSRQHIKLATVHIYMTPTYHGGPYINYFIYKCTRSLRKVTFSLASNTPIISIFPTCPAEVTLFQPHHISIFIKYISGFIVEVLIIFFDSTFFVAGNIIESRNKYFQFQNWRNFGIISFSPLILSASLQTIWALYAAPAINRIQRRLFSAGC